MRSLLIERSLPAPGKHLCGLAWDGRSLWHSDGDTNLIYRIDPDNGSVLAKIPCPNVRTDLSYDGTDLWQIAGQPKRVVVINPRLGRMLRQVDLGPERENACGLCISGQNYWVGFKQRGVIEARSLKDNKVVREYKTLGRADGIALAEDNLWYTDYEQSLLVELDPKTGNELERHSVRGKPTGLCWDGSRFWYSDYANRQISSARLK